MRSRHFLLIRLWNSRYVIKGWNVQNPLVEGISVLSGLTLTLCGISWMGLENIFRVGRRETEDERRKTEKAEDMVIEWRID